MKIIIEIPEKTSAHIRSDYGHGVKGLRIEDMEMLVDAVYHGEPYHVRPRGEWEFIGENLFMCTKCSYIADADYLRKWSMHTFDSEFPDFCPNCGADMREGDRNEM